MHTGKAWFKNCIKAVCCAALAVASSLAWCDETEQTLDNSPADSEDFNILGGDSEVEIGETQRAKIFRNNGTLTVKGNGYIEFLMVGGGGGGGKLSDNETSCGAGGGGAGGVIHVRCQAISAGTYPIVIGAGGAIGANGGDTTFWDRTAYGGGGGGADYGHPGRDGASGGGGAKGDQQTSPDQPGGEAIYGEEGNLGNIGGTSIHRFGPAGGGGAGAPGADHGEAGATRPGPGGDGYCCAILGTDDWYAGGGAGVRGDRGWAAAGGKGGGGSGSGTMAGTDGKGGGGAGGSVGGSGIVIVRFRAPQNEEPEMTLDNSPADSGDFTVTGGDESVWVGETQQARIFRGNGTLTVTGNGYIEFLMVGGGGGGGKLTKGETSCGAGGGGAGGVIHVKSLAVTAGEYPIVIGDGGEPGHNGESTTFLGRTAYGGGYGGKDYGNPGSDGASGGGGAKGDQQTSPDQPGGEAIYASAGNLGNAGGKSEHRFGPAGGGGAGAPGAIHGEAGATRPGPGGDGYCCAILGTDDWYAGGGAGVRGDGGFTPACAKGGGGGSGSMAGVDGLGGGGAGGASGGSGLVIVRFRTSKSSGYQTRFDGAVGGTMVRKRGYKIHTFATDGSFTIPCDGLVEVLLVGGGGGGGENNTNHGRGGGGGGAGGYVFTSTVLNAGTYDVVIGEGGAVGTRGGNTTAFGFTAYGGGAGARPYGFAGGYGASGGGSTMGDQPDSKRMAGGVADKLTEGNLGHNGGSAASYFGPAGGGGAGAAGEDYHVETGVPGWGGDGVMCDITLQEVYYAGGGAGYSPTSEAAGGKGGGGSCVKTGETNPNVANPGENGKGGGGCGGAPGGSGVVIVRYLLPESGLFFFVR